MLSYRSGKVKIGGLREAGTAEESLPRVLEVRYHVLVVVLKPSSRPCAGSLAPFHGPCYYFLRGLLRPPLLPLRLLLLPVVLQRSLSPAEEKADDTTDSQRNIDRSSPRRPFFPY